CLFNLSHSWNFCLTPKSSLCFKDPVCNIIAVGLLAPKMCNALRNLWAKY
ncbi:hypothetical protein NDU88_002931, partial [Pleurodeles waltl]